MSAPRTSQRPVRRERELALPVLTLAALVVIVGVASSARLGGGGQAGERVSVPGGVLAWVYAGFVVAGAVAFPLFLYVSMRTGRLHRSQRRAWLGAAWLVAITAALLALRVLLGDGFGDMITRLRLAAGIPDGAGRTPSGTVPAPDALRVIALVALVLCVVGPWLALRALARRGRLRGHLAEAMTAYVDTTIDDLRHDPDARRAIVRAYSGMERLLARSGVGRKGPEAPLEYVARVLLELDVRPEPVRALTELFERARFSTHTLGEDAKASAIGALERVRADLAALAVP